MKQFLAFRLDTANQCLWREGVGERPDERILLTPKAFSVLHYLVEHAGCLVTQNELLDAIWPDTHVQPEVLKYQVADVRSALGDNARSPVYIETLLRRGYRFVAPVSEASVKPATLSESGSRLVGRAEPLRELYDCLERMLEGERQTVFLTGEPGIGKTALADEFQRRASSAVKNIRIARGQCVEGYGGKEPYYVVREALGHLCGNSGADSTFRFLLDRAPTWALQFPALLTAEDRQKLKGEVLIGSSERMLSEICGAIEAMTAEFPLLVVLEDMQWADPASVDIMSALARGRSQARLMVVATKRPLDSEVPSHPLRLLRQELSSHHLCREILMQPLTEAEVAEYVVGGSALETLPPLVGIVYSRSEGNPLFMIAVLEHFQQRGYVRKEGAAWQLSVPEHEVSLSVPESMRQLIEARISSLTPAEQDALEAASVMGSPFSCAVTASATSIGTDAFDEVCERLARRGQFIAALSFSQFPDGTVSPSYKFVHELYREVFYNRQTPGRIAKSHRRIGERLELAFASCPAEIAAELAYHFEAGRDPSRAVKYLRLRAETARHRHAPQAAIAVLQHALDLCPALPESERAVVETSILQALSSLYLVSFDMRVLEIYRRLRRKAAQYGLLETEVRAYIDVAYPLAWTSTRRVVVVLDRALWLAESSRDPVFRAQTRASCLVRRIWASGWNSKHAEACLEAVEEVRRACDPLVSAWYLVDTNFILWSSSRYREAHRNASESLAILLKGEEENPYPSFVYWLSQFVLPWNLLFLGEWGQALSEIRNGIRVVDKNGDRYRTQTLKLYEAWILLEAMDFTAVQDICEPMVPSLATRGRTPWRRFCTVLAGLADVATGNLERARERFTSTLTEMNREPVIHDWYTRMLLESGLTDLWIAKGDLAQAAIEGQVFLDATLPTAERTWQARAWETNARIAMADRDLTRAQACVSKAIAAMEGFEVPLAAWRVHAVAAEVFELLSNRELASRHRETSRTIISKLSASLGAHEHLRKKFLSASSVQRVLQSPKRRDSQESRAQMASAR